MQIQRDVVSLFFFFVGSATTLDDFKQWSLEVHGNNGCYISGVIILHVIPIYNIPMCYLSVMLRMSF